MTDVTPSSIYPRMEKLFDGLEDAVMAFPERLAVLEWVVAEWNAYVSTKFDDGLMRRATNDEWMKATGWKTDGEWCRQVFQYAARAGMFGVGEEGSEVPMKGRQAAMKMATTLLDGLGHMMKVHGLPPAPGPSGEISEWR